jgi:hypothetical protein
VLVKKKPALVVAAASFLSLLTWNIPFRGVIQSTGSCQVELVNPGTALILECQCLHDQADSHKEKKAFLPQNSAKSLLSGSKRPC